MRGVPPRRVLPDLFESNGPPHPAPNTEGDSNDLPVADPTVYVYLARPTHLTHLAASPSTSSFSASLRRSTSMPAPIRTVRDPKLSAWQSAVNETLIRQHHHDNPATADRPVETDALAGDPRALGTTAFALSLAPGTRGFVLRETHEMEAAGAGLV